MARSKQLGETTELVCISSALNSNSKQKANGKNPPAVSPTESIGMKNNCNYIRKFKPLGRFFGAAKDNPLMQSVENSQDSVHSQQDEEFVQFQGENPPDFLKIAKLSASKQSYLEINDESLLKNHTDHLSNDTIGVESNQISPPTELQSARRQIVISTPNSHRDHSNQASKQNIIDVQNNIFFKTSRAQQAQQFNQSNELIEKLLYPGKNQQNQQNMLHDN